MKNFYSLLLICFLSMRGFSQPLLPSTIGEIFNFEVGDSFQYHTYSTTSAFPQFYTLGIVISKVQSGGYYNYTYKRIKLNSPTQMTIDTFNENRGPVNNVFNPDLPPVAGDCGPPFMGLDSMRHTSQTIDSILACGDMYKRSDYSVYWEPTYQSLQVTFGDGLGETYLDIHCLYDLQTYASTSTITQQIFFHKMNGQTCGNAFWITGFNEITIQETETHIFPNPANSTFQLQLSSVPSKLTDFKLFDALGREVKQEMISNATSTLNRENLSNGIYFWQVETEGRILDRGKLIFE